MNKSPEIMALLNAMTLQFTGRTIKDCIANGICACCGQAVEGFRDDLSKREYEISRMCQKCQDGVFGV